MLRAVYALCFKVSIDTCTDQFVQFMTNVHSKASEEMKELQQSVATALTGFKSLQAYLAEPLMQVIA